MTKALCFFTPYLLSFILSALTLCGFWLGGGGYYSGLLLFFILHPLLDNVFFKSRRLPSRRPERQAVGTFILVMALPANIAFLLFALHRVQGLSGFALTGMILSTGTVMGVMAINIAHELVHRREKPLRAVGVGLLLLCNFAHWGVAHVFGHHKNVATPEDPATARKGEIIYAFWLRSFYGGLRESFFLESRRLKKVSAFFRHRILWYALMQIFLAIAVAGFFGSRGLLFWYGQSLVAIALLLTADYIEHYGLRRARHPETGLYEPMRAEHAWDSYQAWTNYALMNLGFHSHHHLRAALPFPELQEQEKARRLPYGYSLMALMALYPPLFLKIMNSRVAADPKSR